jgi:hypothetical protein
MRARRGLTVYEEHKPTERAAGPDPDASRCRQRGTPARCPEKGWLNELRIENVHCTASHSLFLNTVAAGSDDRGRRSFCSLNELFLQCPPRRKMRKSLHQTGASNVPLRCGHIASADQTSDCDRRPPPSNSCPSMPEQRRKSNGLRGH